MVSVVGAQGSTPREIGARMLVWPERFTGTIGGGSLERQALDQARKLLTQTARRHALQDYPLGPLLGQCCGGHVRLLVEAIDADSHIWLVEAARACGEGAPFRLQADIAGGDLQRSVQAAAGRGPRRWAAHPNPQGPPPLRTAAAHQAQAGDLRRRPRRPSRRPRHRPPVLRRRLAGQPRGSASGSRRNPGRRSSSGGRTGGLHRGRAEPDVLLRHLHPQPRPGLPPDPRCAASGRLPLPRPDRLAHQARPVREPALRGTTSCERRADLARLTCPIGIPSLKSKAPAVIAISLAAELLQLTEGPEN